MSYQVRCDKEDPCGNCQDQMTDCTRLRGMKRLPKLPKRGAVQTRTRESRIPRDRTLVSQLLITGRRSRQVSVEQSSEGSMLNDLPPHIEHGSLDLPDDLYSPLIAPTIDTNYELPGWVSLIPLTDAQIIKQPNSGQSLELVRGRHQTLEFALSIASQLLGGMSRCTGMLFETTRNEELHSFPPIELLYWMLNGIPVTRFNSFHNISMYSFISLQTSEATDLDPMSRTFFDILVTKPSSAWVYLFC